jgi:hypothetical protein
MIHFSPGDARLVLAANERVSLDAYLAAIEALVLTYEDVLGLA